ncbi:MAG: cytochrome c oxidase subunit II [Bacteroidales bacterium]|nr:cytochrome c oxidase subunit II [Bacteroidales bacterium]
MFSNASNFVQGVDTSFAIILGASLFFLVGITGVMVYFVVRYNKNKHPEAQDVHENKKLEITWTVIPTILVLVMFYFGWTGYEPMRKIPEEGIKVKAHAQMWSWQFEYENGKYSDTLVVPKDEAVILDLISRDVVHSLYIPAFRIKEDVVPGVNNKMWFIGQELGKYNIFCAEFCGDLHSKMLSSVHVIAPEEYNVWYNDTTQPEIHPGLVVLKKNACVSCHSLDGTRIVGPSFKGIWGHEVEVITNGEERTVMVDEDYVKRSIYDPNADVVKGFNPGLMIPYQNLVTEEEVNEIIDYLKTLK